MNMTRRKRSPPLPDARKRVAFEIPDSLAQLSALSRSLAQRADIIHGIDKETENSNIVARAQALSNSPPLFEASQPQPAKPIRWRHDQKDFPDAQTWVLPNPSAGSKGHATLLENHYKAQQAQKFLRQADGFASIHGSQSLPVSMPSRPPVSNVETVPQTTTTDEQSQDSKNAIAAKKRKRDEFVTKHQRDFSDSQQWPVSGKRAAGPKPLDKEIEQRRQAIMAKLMHRQQASSSTGVQIHAHTPSPARTASKDQIEGNKTLDLAKDSSQIAALIARKREENAASGQLNKLLHLQVEHRHRVPMRQSWPGAVPSLAPVINSTPALSRLPNWPATPSGATGDVSTGLMQPPDQSGHAEASTANTGHDENAEIDLRSLFSSPGPSPHPRDANKDVGTARASQNAIDSGVASANHPPSATPSAPSQSNDRGPASPSAQLLSSLAHVSSDALAELQTQSTNEASNRPIKPPPPIVQANVVSQFVPRKSIKNTTPTPQAQAKVAAMLTSRQQELMLMQKQAKHNNEKEERTRELRRLAEERAKAVQAENQRRQEQNQTQMQQLQQPIQQPQPQPQHYPPVPQFGQSPISQAFPQPSMAAHSVNNTAYMQPHAPYWSSPGPNSLDMRALMYAQPQNNTAMMSVPDTGDMVPRHMQMRSSTATFTPRYRHASQAGFEIPKR